uniref:Uncharacterized protein n=1 Tax=Setaria italica TaxID=4555 RepID=K3Y2R5_SETIT
MTHVFRARLSSYLVRSSLSGFDLWNPVKKLNEGDFERRRLLRLAGEGDSRGEEGGTRGRGGTLRHHLLLVDDHPRPDIFVSAAREEGGALGRVADGAEGDWSTAASASFSSSATTTGRPIGVPGGGIAFSEKHPRPLLR